MRKVLQEIIEKKHDIETCNYNWKQNGKTFNQIPKTCDFYAGSSSYNDLLLHEILESPDDTDGVDSENDDESKKDVADFRIQLATLEDIKEEILIGCRKQEDQATKEFESLESSLQTL